MRNKTKTIIFLMVAAFFVGALMPAAPSVATAISSDILELPDNDPAATIVPPETSDAEPTEKPAEDSDQEDISTLMGQYYVAKGQPCVFQDPEKGTIKVISTEGNKCKASGNKLTVTCKKTGSITYKIKNKKREIRILVGGNYKDPKVTKKEYDLPINYEGKSYKNFIDMLHAKKKKDKDNLNGVSILLSSKKKLKDRAKYNRGIKYGSSFAKMKKKYPSWEDVGTYENEDCCYAARYYDKKTNYVTIKGFVLDKHDKVKKIVYIAYQNNTIKL